MNRLFLSALLVSASPAIAAPWHHPLYLDGSGWWRQRVPLQITNEGATPLNGFPVAFGVGTAAGQLPLAGQRAEAVRVLAMGTILLLSDGRSLTVAPSGHYSGSPRVDRMLVYIVQTDEGQQTLTPDEFAREYGWKNDPSQVSLTAEPSGQHGP